MRRFGQGWPVRVLLRVPRPSGSSFYLRKTRTGQPYPILGVFGAVLDDLSANRINFSEKVWLYSANIATSSV